MAITINGTDGFSSDNSALKFDTSVFVIDETNNRIGVNTASPSQALDVTGDIEVSGGVYLGGTGSANYLDDYEIGSWSPAVGGTATYAITTGTYVKVGDLVHIRGDIEISTIGTGSTTTISGLPFNAIDEAAISIHYFNAIPSAQTYVAFRTVNSTLLATNGSNSTGMGVNTPLFQNSARVVFAGTYRAS